MAKPVIDPVSSMTSEEALEFVRKMQKAFPKTPRSKKELAALQKYLAKFTDAELRAVGSRVLSDLMQRPPRTINEGDLPPAPIARPEPHGATPPTSGPSVGAKTKKGTKPKAGRARKRTAAGTKPRSARRRARRK
jgi:hypothetical protein